MSDLSNVFVTLNEFRDGALLLLPGPQSLPP